MRFHRISKPPLTNIPERVELAIMDEMGGADPGRIHGIPWTVQCCTYQPKSCSTQ